MKINLFVAGFAKSGSSYIYSLLSSQEDISGGLEKEPAFFSFKEVNKSDLYHDFYEDRKYLLDGTVEYAMDDRSAERIFEYNQEARIIFVIRDPLSRAWSHYWHKVKMGEEKRTLDEVRKSDLAQDYLVSYGQYQEKINAWLKIFGEDKVIVFTLSQIKNDNVRVCQRLEDFLKIKINYDSDCINENSSKIPRLLWVAKFGAFVRKNRLIDYPIPRLLKKYIRRSNRWIQDVNLRRANNAMPPDWWGKKFRTYLQDEIIYYEKMVGNRK